MNVRHSASPRSRAGGKKASRVIFHGSFRMDANATFWSRSQTHPGRDLLGDLKNRKRRFYMERGERKRGISLVSMKGQETVGSGYWEMKGCTLPVAFAGVHHDEMCMELP